MNLTKKIFITFIFLFFFFLGCKQEVEIPNNDDDIELPPVVEEPSDNVKFVNQTDLIVRVFTDPLEGNLVSELKEKAIFWELKMPITIFLFQMHYLLGKWFCDIIYTKLCCYDVICIIQQINKMRRHFYAKNF